MINFNDKIVFDNVTLRYEDSVHETSYEALSGMSFSVAEGEFVSLIGSSGCGKSSTLSILLFVIVAVLTFAQWQMRKRIVFYEN